MQSVSKTMLAGLISIGLVSLARSQALPDGVVQVPPGRLAPNKEAEPLENHFRDDDRVASYADAASGDARAVAGETAARLSAGAANDAESRASDALSKVVSDENPIMGAIGEARVQADKAGLAADAEAQAVQEGTLWSKDTPKMAAKLATEGVQQLFQGTVKAFEEWKMEVLHPPMVEARRAGYNDALPFEKAMQVVEKRSAEYSQRATALSNQAAALRTQSVGLSNGAVARQAVGDVTGAATDMMNAHQMMNQASLFHQQALKLQEQAKVQAINVPAYQAAAQMAAHKKMHQMAPNLMAPPPIPMVPGAPLPPLNVLVQKAARTALLRKGVRANPFKAP